MQPTFGFVSCFFFLTIYAFGQPLFSPQVIGAAGQDFQSSQFQLSYTVGELAAVSTLSAANSTLTQGFHQPDKFTIAWTAFPESEMVIGLYPNPTDDYLRVFWQSATVNAYEISVFDATGRLVIAPSLIHTNFSAGETVLPTSTLAAGSYFIKVASVDGLQAKTLPFNKSNF
ncbi:MAG: T9SS type A sorting domain-containing protein [Bacteroidia bacterium]